MTRLLVANIIICIAFGANAVFADELKESDLNRYFEAWTANDADKIMAFFADGIVYEDVTTGDLSKGPKEVQVFIQKFLASTPGVKLVPSNMVITGDQAAIEWTMSAGSGDEAWEVRGVSMMAHDKGKIIRVTDYWND